MMYHMMWFNTRKPAEMRQFATEEWLPYLREVGKFRVWLMEAEHSMASHQLCLITEIEKLGDIDGWPARAQGDEQGKRLMGKFREIGIEQSLGSVVKNVEGLPW